MPPLTPDPTELHILERQRAHARAGRREHRIGDRRRGGRGAGLADAAPFRAAGEREIDLDLGRVGQGYDLIVAEIALLDAAVLDGDLAVKRGGKAIDHPALDLRFHDAGIDHVAAIDRRDDAVDPHLAFLADGDLGDLADDRAVAFMDGDAAAAAAGSGLPQSLFSAILSSTPRKSDLPASKARRNL